MIKFDSNVPFTTLLGRTDDNARYLQDGYRYTADRKIIGDPIELAKEAKARQLKEAEEKALEARKAYEAVEAESAALVKNAEVEFAKVEETADETDSVSVPEDETVVAD